MGESLNRRDFLKLASVLPLLAFRASPKGRLLNRLPQDAGLPNILVLVFDALSAKNVSLYGYPRATTPNLDKFANRATVYHAHQAPGNFTTPATASIFTGTLPWTHRAIHLFGTMEDSFVQRNLFSLLEPLGYYSFAYTHNDLAALLLNQFESDIDENKAIRDLTLTYENLLTGRVFNGDKFVAYLSENELMQGMLNHHIPSSLFLSSLHLLWRGRTKKTLEAEYRSRFPRGLPSLGGILSYFILEDAIDWLIDYLPDAPRPYLGYVHVLPPHDPYTTRKEFIDIFRDGMSFPSKPQHYLTRGSGKPDQLLKKERRFYDEFIAYADAEFGRLIDSLERSGSLDNTILVVTSDHGEMFERGILAHNTQTLYEPVTHIPLLLSQPGQKTRLDVQAGTSSIDLLPTLLYLLGQPAPEWIEGKILPGVGDTPADGERSLFSIDAKSSPKHGPLKKATITMVKGQQKLIHYTGYKGHEDVYEMYDLSNDPEELEDRYTPDDPLAKLLRDELAQKMASINSTNL